MKTKRPADLKPKQTKDTTTIFYDKHKNIIQVGDGVKLQTKSYCYHGIIDELYLENKIYYADIICDYHYGVSHIKTKYLELE